MLSLDVKLTRGHFDLDARLTTDATVTGLFGPSGSGKSTLLSLVAGLARPQKGRISLEGETLFDSRRGIHVPPEKRRIGLVFQDSQLFPHLPVKGNLLYGYKVTPRNLRRFKPEEVIDLLEIGHLMGSRPNQLSGGEKQRVGLGRALLASPRLLLLDEPLSALDDGLKTQILPFLNRVKSELEIPMIYVSHALAEILQLTDRLAFVQRGRIIAAGAFHEIIRDADTLRLSGVHGVDNVLRVRILGHDVANGMTLARFNDHRILLPLSRLPIGSDAAVGIRSSEIALSRRPVEGISIQNQIAGHIDCVTFTDDRVVVQVDAGSPLVLDLSRKSFTDLGIAPGDRACCLIKAQSFSYLTCLEREGTTAQTGNGLAHILGGNHPANTETAAVQHKRKDAAEGPKRKAKCGKN